MDTREALEADMHRLVPLARAMDVRVARLARDGITLEAPFAGNSNHAGTAFGGSLYSLAVLAGWGWLRERARDAGAEIELLIAGATVRYRRPVRGTLQAVIAPDAAALAALEAELRDARRPRLPLTIRLGTPGAAPDAASVEAQYVGVPLAPEETARGTPGC